MYPAFHFAHKTGRFFVSSIIRSAMLSSLRRFQMAKAFFRSIFFGYAFHHSSNRRFDVCSFSSGLYASASVSSIALCLQPASTLIASCTKQIKPLSINGFKFSLSDRPSCLVIHSGSVGILLSSWLASSHKSTSCNLLASCKHEKS